MDHLCHWARARPEYDCPRSFWRSNLVNPQGSESLNTDSQTQVSKSWISDTGVWLLDLDTGIQLSECFTEVLVGMTRQMSAFGVWFSFSGVCFWITASPCRLFNCEFIFWQLTKWPQNLWIETSVQSLSQNNCMDSNNCLNVGRTCMPLYIYQYSFVACKPAVWQTTIKKHCQRHNRPEDWVHLTKVSSWGHNMSYHT